MSVKCADCGKFISYDDMATGEALFHFEPESEFGHEVSEWVCGRCVLPPAPVDTLPKGRDGEAGSVRKQG